MNVGVKIWSVEDPGRYIDVIINYRWWVPGRDPWRVESKTVIMPRSSGDWYHVYSYGPSGSTLTLCGYVPAEGLLAEHQNAGYVSLDRMPNYPPSEMQVGDEGPASDSILGIGPGMTDVRWAVRWIS
jgi:hypothetical protein